MEKPKYKLIYFDLAGVAEPVRWMFAYKNVPFEDFRMQEIPFYIGHQPTPEWDALKDKTPYGTVPVLEVDGKCLGEAHAIARYVAKQIGLAGADDWEVAQADSMLSYIAAEFSTFAHEVIKELDADNKSAALDRTTPRFHKVAETLEKILRKNNEINGDGWFVGQSVTVADFMVANVLHRADFFMPGNTEKYKSLVDHAARMRKLPGVMEYIQRYTKNALSGNSKN